MHITPLAPEDSGTHSLLTWSHLAFSDFSWPVLLGCGSWHLVTVPVCPPVLQSPDPHAKETTLK